MGAFWRPHWAPFPGSRCSRAFSHYKRCGRRAAPSGCPRAKCASFRSRSPSRSRHVASSRPLGSPHGGATGGAQSTIIVVDPEPGAVVTSTKTVPTVAEPAKPEPVAVEQVIQQPHAPTGWLIQIGAFDSEAEARQHLSEAQRQASTVLAAADPFTEGVQRGDKLLYRARFAGFDKESAEIACKELKRGRFECMALKD
jgi:D-alanyl-D-alanine carboxypeptidase